MGIEGVPTPEKVEVEAEDEGETVAEKVVEKVAEAASGAAEAAKTILADNDDLGAHEEL